MPKQGGIIIYDILNRKLRAKDKIVKIAFVKFIVKASRPYNRVHGGLVIRSRLRSCRIPGSKLDSTEDPRCLWAWCSPNLMWVKRPPASAVRNLGERSPSSGVIII
ncbi:hypothetical protein AVEN_78042-1 [Araneus ventricosus]|uniref:Uncharacterized protein n=1 Tax=Araneus ventricosus TaxID=182803 RepID=A0A4Y2FSW3_ARAVE|nr:hypothetical protein AVEN_78042-1 [Araneus ventricosus]